MGCKEFENINFSDSSWEAKVTTHIFLQNAEKKCKTDLDIKRIN